MGIVTKIQSCKRKKDYADIYIDEEYACRMQIFVILSEGVKEGEELTNARLEQLALLSDGETAFNQSLNYLGIRMRSDNEISQYLKKKGYADIVVHRAIDKLKKYNYINDEIFAKEYVKSASKKSGKRMIKFKLRRFGITDELISTNIDEIIGQDELAYKLATKYLKSRVYDRNKLGSHLQGKGFEWDTISSVVNRIESEKE